MSIHSAIMSASLGLLEVFKIYAYDQTDPGDLWWFILKNIYL